jgi:DNA-binding transcriptional ArsR family regulator
MCVMSNLDGTFSALSDPTRRAILARLALGEATVGELVEPFDISPPAISRHLRVLEQVSLITRERHGQHRICRINARALVGVNEWLEPYRRFWTESLDRLNEHLNKTGGSRRE